MSSLEFSSFFLWGGKPVFILYCLQLPGNPAVVVVAMAVEANQAPKTPKESSVSPENYGGDSHIGYFLSLLLASIS